MMEDITKMGLMSILADKVKDLTATQEKRAKLMPRFENEESALEYAQRVTTLLAGDKAKVINFDDTGLMEAIFTGAADNEGRPIFLAYSPETKALAVCIYPWHSIVVD